MPNNELRTTAGEQIDIINVGQQNPDKKNMFCNARLKIGGREWSGNVVLHTKSSDWEKEICNKEAYYKNVILHVTTQNDIEILHQHGESIPQLQLKYPKSLDIEYENISKNNISLPCSDTIAGMDKIKLHSNLSRLLAERIEEKAQHIYELHEKCDKRWDDTLFKLLARNFGFGIQSGSFEKWARLLSMQAAGKHRDNALQIEALFFGQAGLLEKDSIPYYYQSEALNSKYYNDLLREYKFLITKFNLSNVDYKIWGGGNATPHLRLARLATMYVKNKINISSISECNTIKELRELLQEQPEGYWRCHMQFGGTETTGAAPLKNSQTDLLIINTIAPILYAYGKHRNDISLCNKSEDYLHSLNSEENSIIRRWAQLGINTDCAADSQALIQLQKAYCNRHKCAECHFAYAYIKGKIEA